MYEPLKRKSSDDKKPTAQRKGAALQKKANKTGLPDQLKTGIENLSGQSMDNVKVHYNSSKPAQLQAHAYAQGTDIHLAPGQEKHLPHEAWHVVQQKEGRVKPTMQLHDQVNINDDAGLEKEADVMGAKALKKEGAPLHLKDTNGDSTLQRVELINPASDDSIIQAKITIGSDVYDKKGSNATKALKERMKNNYGGANWKRGWIDYLTESAASPQEIADGPFLNEQELANSLEKRFPANKNGSVEAQFLIDAFRQTDLSLAGFIWKVLKSGIKLNDGRVFTKADLIKAMSTQDGKKLIGDHWRDKNDQMHGDQVIQGKHEWILTSKLPYVIDHAKTIKDLEIWFMAAEMLRTPTQSVIFDFGLDKNEVDYLIKKGGKLSDLDKVSAHPGALYEERDNSDDKKDDPRNHNKQVVMESPKFHKELENLLETHLNKNKSDIKGYLEGLINFHSEKIWSGKISGLSADDFEDVETGFYAGTNKNSEKKDQDMKSFMLRQQQNFLTDQQVLINQARAILFELNSIESGTSLAVDTKKLAELDEDSRFDVETYFEEADKEFKMKSGKLAQSYQTLINKNPSKFDEINQTYKNEWQQLYNIYIQSKSNFLEQTYQKVMQISN